MPLIGGSACAGKVEFSVVGAHLKSRIALLEGVKPLIVNAYGPCDSAVVGREHTELFMRGDSQRSKIVVVKNFGGHSHAIARVINNNGIACGDGIDLLVDGILLVYIRIGIVCYFVNAKC